MKKYFFFTAILTISIIAIFSCRKVIDPEVNPNQTVNSSNETEIKIQSFVNRFNSDLKAEQTYSISEAIWYAEATLNYTYAIYDSQFVYLSRDSSLFSISLNQNNTVNESALIAAYQNMVDSLKAQNDGIQSQTKHVFICDIIDVSNSVGYLDLKLVSVIAYDYNVNIYSSFGPTDYWYAGGDLGKCNGYTGDGDAAEELEYKLLHPMVAGVPSVRVYYTDEITIEDINPFYYPYEYAPRGYRAYYFEGPDNAGIQCIPPNELNFYLSSNGIPYIIDDRDTYLDKEWCDIVVHYDYMAGFDFWLELHFLDISYGIRHETVIGASTL